MNDISMDSTTYEVHYFSSDGLGYTRSPILPWIDPNYDNVEEAAACAKELIEVGYTRVKVMKKIVTFEEVPF